MTAEPNYQQIDAAADLDAVASPRGRPSRAYAAAFGRGCDARLRGEPVSSCPHDDEQLRGAWLAGWADVEAAWGRWVLALPLRRRWWVQELPQVRR